MIALKLAWKNIWRNPVRSAVVMISIGLGVWALMFLLSFMGGMVESYVERSLRHKTSHVQIHTPDWKEEHLLSHHFTAAEDSDFMTTLPGLRGFSERLLLEGVVMSAHATRGTQIVGVDSDMEAATLGLDELIVEGDYFEGKRRWPILISQKTAEKLNVKINSKVVLNFPDTSGSITSGAFKVQGIFKSGDNNWDEAHVFVLKQGLHQLIGLDRQEVHEIAFYLDDRMKVDTVVQLLQSIYPAQRVEDYEEISPELRLYSSSLGLNRLIMTIIIMLALVFGIINTMLMAVLERTRELGMLMAIGMNRMRVFGMIVWETLLLGMMGLPLGLLAGWLTISWTAATGIDLSAFAEGISEFGMDPIVYPSLPTSAYIEIALSVGLTSLLAAIYPSIKATRLQPVEAVRKI